MNAPDPIQMARQKTVEIRLSEAPISVKNTLARAFSGSASPRQAIKAMCLACTGFERQEITDCTGYSCPLWCYRPFQKGDEPDES